MPSRKFKLRSIFSKSSGKTDKVDDTAEETPTPEEEQVEVPGIKQEEGDSEPYSAYPGLGSNPCKPVASELGDDLSYVDEPSRISSKSKPVEAAEDPTSTPLISNTERLILNLPIVVPEGMHILSRARTRLQPRLSLRRAQNKGKGVEMKTFTGPIEIRTAKEGLPVGHIGRKAPSGMLGIMDDKAADEEKLAIQVEGPISGKASGLAIAMLNSDGPLLGLVAGPDNDGQNIGPGNFNYLYLAGVGVIPGSGSLPSYLPNQYTRQTSTLLHSETHIWTLDTTSGELKPTWINADLTKSRTYLWLQAGIVYAGGDPKAFSAKYTQGIQEIKLFLQADLA